jgi:hypothetical protein
MVWWFFKNKEEDTYEFTNQELEIIQKLKTIYGNQYGYSKVRNIKHFKITLICPEHGDFSSSLKILTLGGGCKHCYRQKNIDRLLQSYHKL